MHDDVANYGAAARSNSMSKPVYQSIKSCLLVALAGTLKAALALTRERKC